MIKKCKYVGLLLVLFVFGIQCSSSSVNQNDILGAWEIASAHRDGQETETLNGAYFEFTPEQVLTTNLLGRDETYSFRFDKQSSSIVQSGDREMTYQVVECMENELTLATDIRDVSFKIHLVRIIE